MSTLCPASYFVSRQCRGAPFDSARLFRGVLVPVIQVPAKYTASSKSSSYSPAAEVDALLPEESMLMANRSALCERRARNQSPTVHLLRFSIPQVPGPFPLPPKQIPRVESASMQDPQPATAQVPVLAKGLAEAADLCRQHAS